MTLLSFDPLSAVAENVNSFPALECLHAFEPTGFGEAGASRCDFSCCLDMILTAEIVVSIFSLCGIVDPVTKAQRVKVLESDP